MYQTIHEAIAVAGVFKQGKFQPAKFRWQHTTYQVDEITLMSDTKDGGVRQRHYAVVSGANVYRLLYNRESEEWWLQEVWCE